MRQHDGRAAGVRRSQSRGDVLRALREIQTLSGKLQVVESDLTTRFTKEQVPATAEGAITARTARLLVVDDEEPMRRMLTKVLEGAGFEVVTAGSATEGRFKLQGERFDLLLTDVNMPGGSGLDLAEDVLGSDSDVAVVMVTGEDDPELARHALESGVYGYVLKPFESNEIVIQAISALLRRDAEIQNRSVHGELESAVQEKTIHLESAINDLQTVQCELQKSQEETIGRLAVAAEFRDNETAQHIQRMSRYCALIASHMGESPERCELVRLATVMHDVGKLGIPDRILLKPGPLDSEERRMMERHPEIGYRILCGSEAVVLKLAAATALTHHERIDGNGYPKGLAGDEIPIEGRIAAIADVFDALTTDRVYRKEVPIEEAVETLRAGGGSHFDADLVALFVDHVDEAIAIRDEYCEHVIDLGEAEDDESRVAWSGGS